MISLKTTTVIYLLVDLVGQKIANTLREGVHGDTRRPEHEIRRDALLARLPRCFILVCVRDVFRSDFFHARVGDDLYFVALELSL